MCRKENGYALLIVIIVAVILAIVGLGALIVAEQESVLTRIDTDKARAFYLAEAGLAKLQESLQGTTTGNITQLLDEPLEENLEQGRFSVSIVEQDSNYYAESTGVCGMMKKKVRVRADFLAAPFENAIYASNKAGGAWAFQLRGKGNPVASGGGEYKGKDQVYGNVFVDGDVYMYEESFVKQAPAPNKWNLNGDVRATGSINVLGSASISGSRYPNSRRPEMMDIRKMDYANSNTHNVTKIFQDAGVTKGPLPKGNELRDVFAINPPDRSAECATTTGNDYFLEPVSATGGGTQYDAPTPLHLGNKRIYYVDGDVWVHNKATYGFKVDGQATIVATGNIHICDNLKYADSNSLLGLVALGKYDSAGNLISGGNIFFGDPVYGTMYTISAMMFAANDFLYNTNPISRMTGEPTTGFTVYGNFAAMNRVVIERDWYPVSTTTSHKSRWSGSTSTTSAPARYVPVAGQWIDSETEKVLTIPSSSIKHYQMIVNYDERVRSAETRPPGLPRGLSSIFAGFSNWEEL